MSYWFGALCGFAIFELYYFFRGVTTVVFSQMRRPIDLFSESVHYGVCTFNDVDFFCNHMNNARYMRELDFARIDFFVRLGAVKVIKSGLVDPVWIGASTIRYRKPIYLFFPYRIRTRIAFWADHDVYLAHRFETVHDGFVRAIGYSKVVIPSSKVSDLIKTAKLGTGRPQTPDPERALKAWIEYLSQHREQLHQELNISEGRSEDNKNQQKETGPVACNSTGKKVG